MFYMESDKREIKGWLKKGDDDLRKEVKDEHDALKNLYNQFSAKIEKILEQQEIANMQLQNQFKVQIDELKQKLQSPNKSTR